ncbi:hypothetical protein HHI36_001950 [Cryptolaemus montrouzieri]|uniref:Secreted protein n=1 Tax=Cryptolaemus montrouzieri TaxID=559131 RepID=A0ABD2P904_9CUCU
MAQKDVKIFLSLLSIFFFGPQKKEENAIRLIPSAGRCNAKRNLRPTKLLEQCDLMPEEGFNELSEDMPRFPVLWWSLFGSSSDFSQAHSKR